MKGTWDNWGSLGLLTERKGSRISSTNNPLCTWETSPTRLSLQRKSRKSKILRKVRTRKECWLITNSARKMTTKTKWMPCLISTRQANTAKCLTFQSTNRWWPTLWPPWETQGLSQAILCQKWTINRRRGLPLRSIKGRRRRRKPRRCPTRRRKQWAREREGRRSERLSGKLGLKSGLVKLIIIIRLKCNYILLTFQTTFKSPKKCLFRTSDIICRVIQTSSRIYGTSRLRSVLCRKIAQWGLKMTYKVLWKE